MPINYSPTAIANWQSEVVRDTFRESDRKPIEGGWYEMHFDQTCPNTFEFKLAPNCRLNTEGLSLYLSNGHKKAGYASISNSKFLAPVELVSVRQIENKKTHQTFLLTLVPKYDLRYAAVEHFEDEVYTPTPTEIKEKKT